MKKKVIVSVTNDLATDQRVLRLCHSLHREGFDVLLVGRQLPKSLPMPNLPFRFHRMQLLFRKSALFYAEYNVRLVFFLLFQKADILVANDLDTLPANRLIQQIKRCELVFDSHEYFTGVPELENNPFARKVWKWFERKIVPRLKHLITVNASIANLFKEEYGVDFLVVRNIPYKLKIERKSYRNELNLPDNKRIIVMQGNGINVQRGAEEAVVAMQFLDENHLLLVIGNGDVIPVLKEMVDALNLNSKVTFIGRLPYDEMMKYTLSADLGISLDKPQSINYLNSLPNKIFDYIQAGCPILCSDLPEPRKIIEEYRVGEIAQSLEPKKLADQFQTILNNKEKLFQYQSNALKSSEILCREEEEKKLISLFKHL